MVSCAVRVPSLISCGVAALYRSICPCTCYQPCRSRSSAVIGAPGLVEEDGTAAKSVPQRWPVGIDPDVESAAAGELAIDAQGVAHDRHEKTEETRRLTDNGAY